MKPISFKRHRFPADVIRQAVWLYFRFSLSFRDVEELMAARGVDVTYETIRCWTIKFGPLIAHQPAVEVRPHRRPPARRLIETHNFIGYVEERDGQPSTSPIRPKAS